MRKKPTAKTVKKLTAKGRKRAAKPSLKGKTTVKISPPSPKAQAKPSSEPRLLRHHGAGEFTLDILDDLLRVIGESGCHPAVAASNLGISPEAFSEWTRRGESDREHGIRSDYAYLAIALAATESGVEIRLLRKVIRHPDWRASTWFLEARFPERWEAKPIKVQVETIPPPEVFDWRNRKVGSSLQTAKNLVEIEARVLEGHPLKWVPVNPHDPTERRADGGLRGAVAGSLKWQMDQGKHVPDFIREQVEEYFTSDAARNPLPPQEIPPTISGSELAEV
jgi:hypothetical protein